ncbi:MAG: hypothetical protein WC179_05050 [Candidatus Cloacimonadaceae bacterium]|jgi:hypothetical protein
MSSIANIFLEDDEELIKRKRTDKQHKPNFYMIGNGTMNKHKIQAIDLLDEFHKMSKAEQFIVLTIKDGVSYYNQNGEVYIDMSKFSDTIQRTWRKGFKLLSDKNLVRRTKRSHYMVNPNALIPPDYDSAIELWEKSNV